MVSGQNAKGRFLALVSRRPAPPPSHLSLRSTKDALSTVSPVLWSPANMEPARISDQICSSLSTNFRLGHAVLMMSSTRSDSIQTREPDIYWRLRDRSAEIFQCANHLVHRRKLNKLQDRSRCEKHPLSSVNQGPQGVHSTKNDGGAMSRYIRCPSVATTTTF